MTKLKAVGQVAAFVITGLLLSGCDKLKEIDDVKSEASANKQQLEALKAELATVRGKLAALEDFQRLAAQQKAISDAGLQPPTAQQIASLTDAVSKCVFIIRNSAPKEGWPGADAYTSFDAYYNPGSGRVENNVVVQGGRPALYAFNKCMAARGFPLT